MNLNLRPDKVIKLDRPDNVTLGPSKKINLYITFEIEWSPFYVGNGFTLRSSSFVAKNALPDKYSYFGYGLSFGDLSFDFSLSIGRFGKDVKILDDDMSHLCMLVITRRCLNSR